MSSQATTIVVPSTAVTGSVQGTVGGLGDTVKALATQANADVGSLLAHATTAHYVLPINILAGILLDGTPLTLWADGTSTTPGTRLNNSKQVCVRWNEDAAPAAVWYQLILPPDFDVTVASSFDVLATKDGATIGDASTFTISCFQQVPGALQDAGVDLANGSTNALVGNATAKTVSAKLSLAVAANTFTQSTFAAPTVLSISILPTHVGTDDIEMLYFALVGGRKLLAS